ncbi:hypothetical protein [Streptomyces sp. NBC_01217]|uniref:hypothetical protein n=1 Tax=Streptomyces sp. NBC_01217 TaxID=2903779 RepID=UPI002E12E543|nr:hypothetical protein OG507_34575 [Streptomyces sp. NBC_01217]
MVEAAVPSPAAVYGSSYPDKGEYPAGLSPSTQAPLSFYTLPASQAYVVTGGKKMHTTQHNHRLQGHCAIGIGPVRRSRE